MLANRILNSAHFLGPERSESRVSLSLLDNNPVILSASEALESNLEAGSVMARLVDKMEGFSFLPFKDTIRIVRSPAHPVRLTLDEMLEQFTLKVKVAERVHGKEGARDLGNEAYVNALQFLSDASVPLQLPTGPDSSGLIISPLRFAQDYMFTLPMDIRDMPEELQDPVFNVITAQRLRGIGAIHTPPPYLVTGL